MAVEHALGADIADLIVRDLEPILQFAESQATDEDVVSIIESML